MKRAEAYRFSILVSILGRHDRACESTGRTGVEHDLSNVQKHGDHIVITTTTGQRVVLTGSVLSVDEFEIPIDRIQEIGWITQDQNSTEKARQKQEHFDRLHIRHHNDWVIMDGLGQSVFPVMQFLKWAKRN